MRESEEDRTDEPRPHDAMKLEIRDERDECRYSAYLDGRRVGHAAWVLIHETVVLPHVRVEPGAATTGIGSLLVRRAFDDARAEGHGVLPWCPYTRRWAQLHPGYADVARRPRAAECTFVQRAVTAAEAFEEMTANRATYLADTRDRA